MRQMTVELDRVRRFREALAVPGAPAAPDGHVPVTFPVVWWGSPEGFGQGAIVHADQGYAYPGGSLRTGERLRTEHVREWLGTRSTRLGLARFYRTGETATGEDGAVRFRSTGNVLVLDSEATAAEPEPPRVALNSRLLSESPAEPELEQPFGRVTQEWIQAYAEASGDFNPIHLNPAAAAAAGLPATIAHGMFSMGLLGEMAACWAGNTGWVAHLFVRFRGIVPSGTELRGLGVTAPLLDGRPGRLLYLAAVTGRGEVVTTGVAEVQTYSSDREGTA